MSDRDARRAARVSLGSLYGVMAQTIEQRSREIGVRLALGAEPASIFRLIMRRALSSTLAGIATGAVLAGISIHWLDPLLYQVRRNDPGLLLGDAVILPAASALAAYLPSRRATRVDPLISLRAE
jgi:ABC-type antimicrobial peptide transport system permease subunit